MGTSQVAIIPIEEIKWIASGVKTKPPAPNPATANPVINPRLSGNHLTHVAMGQTYAI
jgi:hypothetical protein